MKEDLKVAAMCAAAVTVILVIRDNMPKQSFSVKN